MIKNNDDIDQRTDFICDYNHNDPVFGFAENISFNDIFRLGDNASCKDNACVSNSVSFIANASSK